jgi:iron complex outermembrane recepter protein
MHKSAPFYSCLLMLLVLLVSFSKAQNSCKLEFSGRVMDYDTHQPLQGAIVRVHDINIATTTDTSGYFFIQHLCAGNHSISISHIGCTTISEHIHFKKNMYHVFELPHLANQLQEVVVSGFKKTQVGQLQQDIKEQALEMSRGTTLGEALSKITGVTVLQTGTNIFKPVINGLHSNRVLIINNGIRQEGQQWGSEHAPEIDPYIANKLTVIKGASSIQYGGDAIGGVVLVEPKLLPNTVGKYAELNTAVFSNNRMGVISGFWQQHLKRQPFSYRVQATIKRGGNARTPNYWLANSGLAEANLSVAAAYQMKNSGHDFFYSLFNTKIGIFSGSHIGNVTDMLQAINVGEPPEYIKKEDFSYIINRPYQQVQHHLFKHKYYQILPNKSRINVVSALQYNSRDEFDTKRFASSNNNPQLSLQLFSASTEMNWEHQLLRKTKSNWGVTASYQQNSYQYRYFIPNYQSMNAAIFLIEKYQWQKWQVEAGIRHDIKWLSAISSNTGKIYKNQLFSGTNGTVGLNYTHSDVWQSSLHIGTAWRSPHINELFSDGLHHGAARIEKGNSQLQPERAYSLALGSQLQTNHWQLSVGLFTKSIQNFIYLNPVYPPELTIRGAFPTFTYTQTNALLYGLDANSEWQINHHLSLLTKLSLLRAKNTTTNEWLIAMPSDRLEQAIKYHFSDAGKWKEPYIQLAILHVWKQHRIPASGNIPFIQPDGTTQWLADYANPPEAYFLLNAEASITHQGRKNKQVIGLVINNLSNTIYKDYLNSFRYFAHEMGTNIALKIKFPFQL